MRWKADGLNSLKYELSGVEVAPLYTKYLVYYDEQEYLKTYDYAGSA
jgi:hypothetical protein